MDVEKQVTINAPVEQVFAYLSDIQKHSEWAQAAHKLEVEKTSEGPVGQGSTFRSVGHQFGRNEDSLTVTEFVPNQRFALESAGNAGVLRHTFEVKAAEGGTQVTKGLDIVQTKFPFTLFAPMVKAFIAPGGLAGDLQRIKANIEGS